MAKEIGVFVVGHVLLTTSTGGKYDAFAAPGDFVHTASTIRRYSSNNDGSWLKNRYLEHSNLDYDQIDLYDLLPYNFFHIVKFKTNMKLNQVSRLSFRNSDYTDKLYVMEIYKKFLDPSNVFDFLYNLRIGTDEF